VAALLVSAACEGATSSEGPPTSGDDGSTMLEVPMPLAEFVVEPIRLGDRMWRVAVAATSEQRFRGLRGIADLGDLDGMVFVYEEDSTAAFTMRDTLMPIDVAFFDADGALVDRLSMVPCTEEPCPRYVAGGAYRYAVETEAGGFDGIETLVLDPSPFDD
jgi:uncharacterized membrane protein (UPF0127 family)